MPGDESGDSLELRLVEVQRHTAQPGAPRPEPFTLLFESDPARTLEQGMYSLEHGELGTGDVFLVPIEPGQYEAIFN